MDPRLLRDDGERSDVPESIIPAVLAGDADALARWFRSEHPVVWRLCMGFLADRTEADDAAQDAMLHLFDRLDRWDRRRAWTTWRNSVVLNHCRDRVRRAATRRKAEREAATAALPQTLPHPLETTARAELASLVTTSLQHLSPREREVFVLHDLEGGTTAEVASALEIAESTVRVLLATARRRLRELLAARVPGIASATFGGGADA